MRTATQAVVDPGAAEADAWTALHDAAAKRLKERIDEHGAPPVPGMPIFDGAYVYRFPSDGKKSQTEGGLYIPETAQEDEEPKSYGLLLQAGLEARDLLRDHGAFLGDVVLIGRFAGWERENDLDKRGQGRKKLLLLNARDIKESVDLKERLWGKRPTMKIVYLQSADGGTHVIRPIF